MFLRLPYSVFCSREREARWLSIRGVVGVSAIAPDGQLTAPSSWGQVVTASLGANVNVRVYPDKNVEKMDCSNCAAAITTGFLALAREKWPQATGNQLLQLLVRTGMNSGNSWNERTGFGPTNLEAMLSTDPTQFPDENPLPDKKKLGKTLKGLLDLALVKVVRSLFLKRSQITLMASSSH